MYTRKFSIGIWIFGIRALVMYDGNVIDYVFTNATYARMSVFNFRFAYIL